MSRMFTPEPSLSGAPNATLPETAPETAASADYEFVLGGRQIASVGLVTLTILGIATGGAYIVGKSAGRTVEKIVTVEAPAAVGPTPAATPLIVDESPLFGAQERGKLYLQLASVERGYAQLMARGVRNAGYPAFVAEGMNPNVFRVLAGPFDSSEELQSVKTVFDAMGLNAFLRKYEPAPATTPSEPEEQ